MENSFSGEVFIHAVPRVTSRQVDWMLSDTLGYQVALFWQFQPALNEVVRSQFSWQGDEAFGAEITSALAGWRDIYFEVTQFPNGDIPGGRWQYTPELGIKHRTMDSFGNHLVGEGEIKNVLENAENLISLQWALNNLVASAWDEALEPLRSQTLSVERAAKYSFG